MVQKLATDAPEGSVTSDNFTGLVAVLDDFASAAGAAMEGQRQDKRGATITPCVLHTISTSDTAHQPSVSLENPSSNED